MASNHYLTSEEIRNELQICHLKGKITIKFIEMMTLMVDRIQRPFPYTCKEDKEDVRSHAIEKMLTKWKKCDVDRPNLFSFFTQVIKNDLYAGWNKISKGKADVSYDAIFETSV